MFGIDVRLLLFGIVLGLVPVLIDDTGSVRWLYSARPLPAVASHPWGKSFARVQQAFPIFKGHDPFVVQEPPPIQAMSPVQQRQLKEAEARARQIEEARVHAPVYVLTSSGDDITDALRRIRHELTEHIAPRGLFIVSSTPSDSVQVAWTSAALPLPFDAVLSSLSEAGMAVQRIETPPKTRFEPAVDMLDSLIGLTPSLRLMLPETMSHEEAVEAGHALHRLREEGIALLVDSPGLAEKAISAATQYTSTDRHRTVSAYSAPLLSFAAGAADEAEGEAIMKTPAGTALLRFGFIEDHGDDLL